MADSDFLDLQHLIGYTGHIHSTATFNKHTSSQQYHVSYAVGSQLVLSSLDDAHDQTFINEHHSTIHCIKSTNNYLLSASRDLLLLYNFQTQKLQRAELPVDTEVRSIDISEDERFVVAATENSCWIWSLESDGQLQLAGSLGGNSSMMNQRESGYETALWLPFSEQQKKSRRKSYEIVVYCRDKGVEKLNWTYDPRTMSYGLDSRVKFQLPGRISGLKRSIGDAIVFRDADDIAWLVVGTESGEAMVFNASSNVYRSAVLICSGGILSIQILSLGSTTEIVVGGGDGGIRVVRGHDTKWQVVREGKSRGRVTSLSVSGSDILCGSNDGTIQIFHVSDSYGREIKRKRMICESHLARIRDVTFCSNSSDFFVTCSDDGTIRRWNLNDYSITHLFVVPKGVQVTKCVYYSEDEIIVGCTDGFVRNYSLSTGKTKWQIVNAHRGSITALAVNDKYICTGGEDSAIRLWHGQSHELVGQFTGEHTKTVTDLVIDVEAPFILHSCSVDRTVLTFDLTKNKRLTYHASTSKSQNRAFTCMTQKLTGERELITGSSDGKICFWDIDYRDPVEQIEFEEMRDLNDVRVSPLNGRYLASVGNDGNLRLWDIKDNRATLSAQGRVHSCAVTAVKWSPDQKQIITVAADGAIGVWSWFKED